MNAPLGPMPAGRRMVTVDERLVRAPVGAIFALARDVERWPAHLPHYRWVREVPAPAGAPAGRVVEMAAWRPFGPLRWPTWWRSLMETDEARPAVRFRHVGGITTGMDVEWTFEPRGAGTFVRIVHVWDGPRWPLVGALAATAVIGPVFIHGIASRTLAGLAAAAERDSSNPQGSP
ncbi:MAG TPA: SRPBCC family protein [Gemmatimonadaceae bacterium]|nr:SRPBCC family protein [Gemmatimonadaceae bacterium]